MIKVEILNRPDLMKKETKVSKGFRKSLTRFVDLGAKYLRNIAPGKLEKSIKSNDDSIWSTADYYKYVDKGTKPHTINGLLVFNIGGVTVFSWGVKHPGTKAQKLTNRTVDYMDRKINTLVKDVNRSIT